MVDVSGEAKPADGALARAPPATVGPPALSADAAAQLAIERGTPVPAAISATEPKRPPAPVVGDPLSFTGEGGGREAVAGAPAAIEMLRHEPAPLVEPLTQPSVADTPPSDVKAMAPAPLPEPTQRPAVSTEPSPEAEPAAEPAPAANAPPEPSSEPTVSAPAIGDPPAQEGDRRESAGEPPTDAVEKTPPPAAAEVVAPIPRNARPVPPIFEFAAWRLLELVATVVVAATIIGLIIPGSAPADPTVLADRLGVTIPLIILALLIAALVGLPIGYISARAGGWVDVGLRALTTLGLAINPIWLAMLLVLALAHGLQWLQPGGFIPWSNPLGALTSLVLPALALGLPLAAETASRLRDALAAILAGPAMRTADTRGYSRAEAIRDFALRLALARASARLSIPLSLLVPMSLVIEAVFYLPGLGRLIFTALAERDFATLQLGLVTLVALVALCRFLGLLLQAGFDPRVARRV